MPTYFPENNEALPTDSVERSMAKVVSQLPAALDKLSLDPHVAVFIERTGATDVANLDAFVKGVKALGLWNNMVCWPLRRSQNSGTNTAYSLGGLGTFNGTLVNGPTWGADGVRCAAFGQELSLGVATALHSYGPFSNFSVQKHAALDALGKITTWMRQDAFWPAATRIQVSTNGANHRLNVSNTRRVSANITVNLQPWHSQLTATAGNESGFVTYNKGTPVAFGAATADAQTPIGFWRIRGEADVTTAFQLIAHQNAHAVREQLYDLYKQTLGTGLGLP